MFEQKYLNLPNNLYILASFTNFEDITIGRKGAILCDTNRYIVRSTTNYNNNMQYFNTIHNDIMKECSKYTGETYNNAMIEMYDENYTTMKYHSDMALDLTGNTICIYSCYPSDDEPRRKLKIKNKTTNIEQTITLENNSIVYFSLGTNKQYLHKIIGKGKWLGITFRNSQTKADNLTFATVEEKRYLLSLRKQENSNIDFSYPIINYTLSYGDLLGAITLIPGSTY